MRKLSGWYYPIFFFPLAICFRMLLKLHLKTLQIEEVNTQFCPFHPPEKRCVIYLFWHGKNLLMLRYLHHPRTRFVTRKDLKHQFLQDTAGIPESSKIYSALPALEPLQIVDLLRQGYNIGIPADGPYGPAGKIKSWIFHTAIQSNASVIPIRIQYEKSFRIPWRWDKYEIPLPFSKVILTAGPLIAPDPDFIQSSKKALGPC